MPVLTFLSALMEEDPQHVYANAMHTFLLACFVLCVDLVCRVTDKWSALFAHLTHSCPAPTSWTDVSVAPCYLWASPRLLLYGFLRALPYLFAAGWGFNSWRGLQRY